MSRRHVCNINGCTTGEHCGLGIGYDFRGPDAILFSINQYASKYYSKDDLESDAELYNRCSKIWGEMSAHYELTDRVEAWRNPKPGMLSPMVEEIKRAAGRMKV